MCLSLPSTCLKTKEISRFINESTLFEKIAKNVAQEEEEEEEDINPFTGKFSFTNTGTGYALMQGKVSKDVNKQIHINVLNYLKCLHYLHLCV